MLDPKKFHVEFRVRVRMKPFKKTPKKPVIIYVICSDLAVAEKTFEELRVFAAQKKKDILGARLESRMVTDWSTVKAFRSKAK